ncbi:MAG: class I SAM-dependent methyltransferase [Thermodesulfobacteriota bacterium]
MKLEDIHKKDFVEKVHALMDKDRDMLVAMRDRFVDAPCPACLSENLAFAFSLEGLDASRCLECGTVFINPRPTGEVMAEYFARSEGHAHWFENMPETLRQSRRGTLYRDRLERLLGLQREYGVGNGVALEIGGGDGTFVDMMVERGVFSELNVLEPMPMRRAWDSVRVIRSTIEDAVLPQGQGDCVIGFEVLEHLLEPRVFVGKAYDFLKTGGHLYLTTPNYEGFEIKRLGTASTSVGYDHLNYFNLRSLEWMLAELGFDVVFIETPGKLDLEMVRARFQEGRIDLADAPVLRYVLTDGWEANAGSLQRWIVANKLSSHMACLARKRA